ncbi:MAG: hypothetical protein ABSF35_11030 [Polyangia bacterium]|jgi:Tfp pilus assembly protein PilP
MRRTRLALFLLVGFVLAPWGDFSVARAAPPKPPAKPAPGGKPAAAAAPTAATSATAEALQQRLAILRRKVLRDEDFNETDDANRDPFRSFTGIFSERNPRATLMQQVPAIFGKFALEELTLIAVISGDANPRAMFRDPSGLGQVIKRGDYVSKSSARVTKILSDRVVLELAEITSGGETRALEKAILVNPEGAEK